MISEFNKAEDFKANYKLLSLLTAEPGKVGGKLGEIVPCIRHPDKPVAYFCKAGNMAVCVDCMFDQHNGHLLVSVYDMCKL